MEEKQTASHTLPEMSEAIDIARKEILKDPNKPDGELNAKVLAMINCYALGYLHGRSVILSESSKFSVRKE